MQSAGHFYSTVITVACQGMAVSLIDNEEGKVETVYDTPTGPTPSNGENELATWLMTNNLHHVISPLQSQNISLDELLELASDPEFNLRQYLIDLEIDSPSITRISYKINKLLNDRHRDDPHKPAVVRVIMSQQEDEALNELAEYHQEITSLLTSISAASDQVIANEITTKSMINDAFERLSIRIQQQHQMMLDKLQNESRRKLKMFTEATVDLHHKQEIAKNFLETWDRMLSNGDWDKNERKQEIVSMVRGVTAKRIKRKCTANIPTDFEFIFNESSIAPVNWYNAMSLPLRLSHCSLL